MPTYSTEFKDNIVRKMMPPNSHPLGVSFKPAPTAQGHNIESLTVSAFLRFCIGKRGVKMIRALLVALLTIVSCSAPAQHYT